MGKERETGEEGFVSCLSIPWKEPFSECEKKVKPWGSSFFLPSPLYFFFPSPFICKERKKGGKGMRGKGSRGWSTLSQNFQGHLPSHSSPSKPRGRQLFPSSSSSAHSHYIYQSSSFFIPCINAAYHSHHHDDEDDVSFIQPLWTLQRSTLSPKEREKTSSPIWWEEREAVKKAWELPRTLSSQLQGVRERMGALEHNYCGAWEKSRWDGVERKREERVSFGLGSSGTRRQHKAKTGGGEVHGKGSPRKVNGGNERDTLCLEMDGESEEKRERVSWNILPSSHAKREKGHQD